MYATLDYINSDTMQIGNLVVAIALCIEYSTPDTYALFGKYIYDTHILTNYGIFGRVIVKLIVRQVTIRFNYPDMPSFTFEGIAHDYKHPQAETLVCVIFVCIQQDFQDGFTYKVICISPIPAECTRNAFYPRHVVQQQRLNHVSVC